jgi:hypothetical protein
VTIGRRHETNLRTAVSVIRTTIDGYKKAGDGGHIAKATGYPIINRWAVCFLLLIEC